MKMSTYDNRWTGRDLTRPGPGQHYKGVLT